MARKFLCAINVINNVQIAKSAKTWKYLLTPVVVCSQGVLVPWKGEVQVLGTILGLGLTERGKSDASCHPC